MHLHDVGLKSEIGLETLDRIRAMTVIDDYLDKGQIILPLFIRHAHSIREKYVTGSIKVVGGVRGERFRNVG